MSDTELSFYPVGMASALRQQWVRSGYSDQLLPDDRSLSIILDRLYQASLLREEGVPVKCRVIVASPDALQAPADPEQQFVVLRFANACELTPHDIRKLAAAAGFYRALLAVEAKPDKAPVIWGIVITGTKWVNRFGSERFDEADLPPSPVLQILSPGHLLAACGYQRVFELSGGKLLTEGLDPFRSAWLTERFSGLHTSLLEELGEALPSQTQLCDYFVRDVAQSVMRRVLGLVRGRGHGGMLVYLAGDVRGDVPAERWFRFRIRFADDHATLWFRSLLARLVARVLSVGGELGLPVCRWSDYRQMHDPELAVIDDALIGFGHVLADLMSVDGSVILDRDFRLVGFGSEILGESHVRQIHRAYDLEAERIFVEPADSAGTRHRSAYRLVDGLPGSVAVVVSQDGDVRFVAHHRQKLTYWPYLP